MATRRSVTLSLHGRIRVLTMSVAALAVAVSALAIYLVAEHALMARLSDQVSRNADALVASERYGVSSSFFGFRVGDQDGYQLKVAVVTPSGELVGITPSTAPFTNSAGVLDDAEQSVVNGTTDSSLREVRGYMLAAERTTLSGQTVLVAESVRSISPLLSKLTLALVLIGAFLVALAGVAGSAVARTGLRPIRRLRAATDRVARTADFEPIAIRGDDELASLAASFNEMLTSLSGSRARQSQLIIDASDELMNPLAVLRTDIDLLMAQGSPGTPALDPDAAEQLRTKVMEQMDIIIRLVHDLVDSARGDEKATGQPS